MSSHTNLCQGRASNYFLSNRRVTSFGPFVSARLCGELSLAHLRAPTASLCVKIFFFRLPRWFVVAEASSDSGEIWRLRQFLSRGLPRTPGSLLIVILAPSRMRAYNGPSDCSGWMTRAGGEPSSVTVWQDQGTIGLPPA